MDSFFRYSGSFMGLLVYVMITKILDIRPFDNMNDILRTIIMPE